MQLEWFTRKCNSSDWQTHATCVIHTHMQLDMQLNMQLEWFAHRRQSNDLHIDATQHATRVFNKYMQLEWLTHRRNSTWNSSDSHIYATRLCVQRDAYHRYACMSDAYALLWCHTDKRVSHTNEHLVYLVCPCLPSRINTNPSYRCKLHATHIVVSCHTHKRAMPHSRKRPLYTYRTASLKVNTDVPTHSYVRHTWLKCVMKWHYRKAEGRHRGPYRRCAPMRYRRGALRFAGSRPPM